MILTYLRMCVVVAFCSQMCCVAIAQNTNRTNQTKVKPGEAHLAPVNLPEITAPKLRPDQKNIELPGVFSDVVVGGGGRYFIFHLKKMQQLAIFDLCDLKVVKRLSLSSNNIAYTAGADKLVIASRDQKTIERYSLLTFKKELTQNLQDRLNVAHVTMGAASNGPILLGLEHATKDAWQLLDLQTLGPSSIKPGTDWKLSAAGNCEVYASADGRVFGVSHSRISPAEMMQLRIKGNKIEARYTKESRGVVYPSSDGRWLFSNSGIFNDKLEKVDSHQGLSTYIPARFSDFYFVPTHAGLIFSAFVPGGKKVLHDVAAMGPEVHPGRRGVREQRGRQPFRGFSRYFYIQQAQMMLYLPESNDSIDLRSLDMIDVLKKNKTLHIYKFQAPKKLAFRGETYESEIKAKSLYGNVTFRLNRPPKGMTMTPEGKIRWEVPQDFGISTNSAGNKYKTIISLDDDSGKDMSIFLELEIRDKPQRLENLPQAVASNEGETHLTPVSLPPITTPKFDGEKLEVKLPRPYALAAPGGGGRYIVFYLPEIQQLALFDVSAAKLVKYLTLESNRFAFCVSADKLVILYLQRRNIQRYKLSTFEKEYSRRLSVEGALADISMDPASNGPIILDTKVQERNVGREKSFGKKILLDLESLEPLPVKEKENVAKLFLKKPERFSLKQVSRDTAIYIHLADDSKPLVAVPDVWGKNDFGYRSMMDKSGFSRFHFIPEADTLVHLPQNNNQSSFYLRRVNFDQELKKSDQDYLFVLSRPVKSAKRGGKYEYTVDARSKSGSVKYNIDSGPVGMTISPTGAIEWQVPPDLNDDQVNVIASITARSGKKQYQSFQIKLQGKAAPATNQVEAPPVITQMDPDAVWKRLNTVFPITLPALEPAQFAGNQKQVKLPSEITDLVVGGGGHYLILYFSKIHQLGIFDTSKAELIKLLPVDSEKIMFAAGAEHLLIVYPERKTLERWSLKSLQRETTALLPIEDPLEGIAIGNASLSPLVLFQHSTEPYFFVDPVTMQEIKLVDLNAKSNPATNSNSGMARILRIQRERQRQIINRSRIPKRFNGTNSVSADGRLVSVDYGVLNLTASTIDSRGIKSLGYKLVPNSSGTRLYTEVGAFTPEMQQIGKQQNRIWHIPSVQLGYFITVLRHNYGNKKPPKKMVLHIEDDQNPQFLLPDVDITKSFTKSRNPVPSFEKRYTYIPDANLLVQIPDASDTLILHKIEIDRLLKESGEDYLYVTSFAPATGQLGKPWGYQFSVKSKQNVTYQLETAPKGMKVSPTGLVSWNIPSNFSSSKVSVLMRLKSQSGKELYHNFTITVPEVYRNARQQAELAAKQRAELQKAELERKIAKAEAAVEASHADENRLKSVMLKKEGPTAKAKLEKNAIRILKNSDKKLPSQSMPYRIWTDATGNQIEAQLVNVFGGIVKVRIKSGRINRLRSRFNKPEAEFLSLSQSELNSTDQKYVQQYIADLNARRRQGKTAGAAQVEVTKQLQLIGTAIKSKTSRESRFPAAYSTDVFGDGVLRNRPLLSWRVHLLPYLGGAELYNLFRRDEPWNSTYNKQLIPLMPSFYRSPGSKADQGKTNLLGVKGKDCIFIGKDQVSPQSVWDGLDQTAMVIVAPDEMSVEWTKPDDWEYTSAEDIKNLFHAGSDVFWTLFADGTVKTISNKNSLSDISRIFTRNDKQPVKLK